jgi:hypothetical protein
MTIDDYAEAKALMREMETQLPIPVRATKEFVCLMKPHGLEVKRGQELSIKDLFYLGDEGGIACDVTPPEANSAVVCSLTHVEIAPSHPLAEKVQVYQQARKKGLAWDGRISTSAFIPPSKKTRPRKRKRRRRWR